MSNYIDGFAFPIPLEKLDQYRRLSNAVEGIWLEHGAIEYREFVGDDMNLAGTRSFSSGLAQSTDEVTVFGWVKFNSKVDRDNANKKVAADPRVAKLVNESDTGFDPSRMLYGGFKDINQ